MNATPPRIRMLGWRAAAVVLASAVAVVPHPVGAAEPPADAPAVSLIGDSTMAAMAWYSTATNDIRDIVGQSYRLTFDAQSCRRIVIASCRGRFDSTPYSVVPLMKSALRGRLGEAVVIMAGYDDPSLANAVDQVMAEARAQGVIKVLWLNYRTSTRYVLPGGLYASALYGSHNSELDAAVQRHPELEVLDWNGFTADRPAWFAGDGIHLTVAGAVGLAHFVKDALDAEPAIGRCRASSALTGAPDAGPVSAAPPSSRSGFVPLQPARLLDTRDPALGGSNGKLGAGRTVTIDLSSSVPADAVAAVLSVTAVDSCLPGFLTVFPCGARPTTSNVNYEPGRTTAGLAITTLSSGAACIFASAATDVVVDVLGAFTPDGHRFHPLTPARWIDTRGAQVQLAQITGTRTGPAETTVAIGGRGGVPSSATAAWLNLTVADPTAPTVLSAYPGPCGASTLSSNVNARPLRSVAASVLVGLGPDGSVCVRTVAGSSHVVIDVAGWFGPGPGALAFRPRLPERLLDTRSGGGPARSLETPVTIGAVSVVNVAAVDSTASGYVTVAPCGSVSVSSLLNTATAEDIANVTAVAGDSAGTMCVRPNTASHLVVDRVATFVP